MIRSWTYILFSYSSLFILGMADNVRGPLLPDMMREFQLNHLQASLIFVTASSLALIAGFAAVSLIHRFSLLRTLGLACVLVSVGFLIVYSAQSLSILLFGIALFGFGFGLMGVSQNLMGSLSSDGEIRNKVISGLHSMYGLASFLVPLIVIFTSENLQNWRYAFLIIAVASLALAVPLFTLKDHDHFASDNSDGLKHIHISFPLVKDGLILASYVAAEILVSSRIATFAREAFNYEFAKGAELTSLFFVLLLAGRVYFTFFKSPIPIKKALYVSLFSTLALLILGIFISPWLLALCGLTMSFYYPFTISYLSERHASQVRKIISVAMVTQSFIVVLMHLTVGTLSDMIGVQRALLLGAVFLIIPICILFYNQKSEV